MIKKFSPCKHSYKGISVIFSLTGPATGVEVMLFLHHSPRFVLFWSLAQSFSSVVTFYCISSWCPCALCTLLKWQYSGSHYPTPNYCVTDCFPKYLHFPCVRFGHWQLVLSRVFPCQSCNVGLHWKSSVSVLLKINNKNYCFIGKILPTFADVMFACAHRCCIHYQTLLLPF